MLWAGSASGILCMTAWKPQHQSLEPLQQGVMQLASNALSLFQAGAEAHLHLRRRLPQPNQ